MNPILNSQVATNVHQLLSKAGYLFDEHDDYWQLDKDVRLNVISTTDLLDAETKLGFLKTLAFYARNLSASHTRNIVERFRHMLKEMGENQISPSMLINYKSTLTDSTEWYLGTIRGFLKQWYKLGYSGVSDDVVQLISNWSFKGNEKGDLIKRLDPLQGPLSDIELQGFNENVVQAFEKKKISLSDLALSLCLSHTGRRPIQISHLKIKDILQSKNKSGDAVFFLNVPRAKQRGVKFRGEFKQFAITSDLWAILNTHTKEVAGSVSKSLGFKLDLYEELELPLFPCYSSLEEVASVEILREIFSSDRLHIQASVVSATVQRVAQLTNLHSERTGKPINISANRFRYTMGTRAAREGFGEMVIAELLDHSDTQNAGVYIQNIPEHVEKLDQAVGQYLAPYAQAFAGVLVDTEKDAVRGNDITSRIRTGANNIGTCGNHGFCGANAPIPCYTCIHFQPWVDGPHKFVYDGLIEERERLQQVTGDSQIAAINDRTIIAVADVIQRCEKRKEELRNGRNILFQTQSRIGSCTESQ